MKKQFLALLLIGGVCGTVFSKPPETGPIPPLQFKPAVPDRVVLNNGIVVFLLEDHELPLFDLSLKFKVSPADEPENLRGLMGVMGSTWRVGGTISRSPDALNEQLEFMAAHVETGAGEESASISVSCLNKDRAQTLEIFKDVLLHPRFSEDQIALAKTSILEGLRRKNDGLFEIGRRAFRDTIYGPTHYYAWNATPAFVGKIKRSDLMALHKKVINPGQAMMAVSGDFKKDELIKELNALFVDWTPAARTVPTFDYAVKASQTGKVFHVQKDYTQSLIYMGGLGLTRFSPDEHSMSVTNYILGEGGPSRLFMDIRSRMGLAYVVASFYTMPKGPGLSGVVCQTKAASTLQAIQALRKEVEKLAKEPPLPSEIQLAKDSIINSFVFRFDNPSHVVNEQADLEFYGYPKDYLKTYLDKIRKVSATDVQKDTRKYFSYEKMKILVVGDTSKFSEPLERLGPVTDIPLESIE